MSKEYNFYPFNFEKIIEGKPVQKWVYKNRCVLENVLSPTMTFLCGYVALAKKEIPKDWWGNYSAIGLQQLAIHGGLTYCEIYGADDQEHYLKEYHKKQEELVLNEKDNVARMLEKSRTNSSNIEEAKKDLHEVGKILEKRKLLHDEYNKNLSKTDTGYVVFGFDCGHHRDEQNPSLKDPNHVMMLVEQMSNQLLLFRDHYQDYLDAEKEPIIKNVKRKAIMTQILNEADLQTGISIGHIIDILTHKVDPDETAGNDII